MNLISRLIIALLWSLCAEGANERPKLTIGAIFDIQTKPGDENSAGMIPAVQMALRDVNNCPDTLVNYELELDIKDVKCKASHAVHAMIEFIRDKKKKIMLLGPGCSKSSEPFAQATPFYNLVEVSMASANPALSCAKNFPTFVRTIPPEHYQNHGRAAIVKHFGWEHVAVLWERLDTFQGLANDLVSRLKKSGVQIITFESFRNDPELQLENIQKKDSRIIFGIFSEKVARRVMCQSFSRGLYGPKYVWILMSGGYRDRWWTVRDTNCSAQDMRAALGHFLGTQALMYGADNDMTVARKTVRQLWLEYQQEMANSSYPTTSYAAFAYDAVWTIGLTLNKAITELKEQNKTKNMTLEDFNYNNRDMRDTFMKIMRGLSFSGMSGHVSFFKNMDRLSYLTVDQFQGEDVKQIATYSMKTKALAPSKNALWNGGKGVPACTRKTVHAALHIQMGLVGTMDALCSIGIIIALGILLFNAKYRNIRYIKMSSPRMNAVIIMGCILIYLSGILLGLDGQFVSDKHRSVICQAQTWTISFGFTMAFGGLFSKTWRVHQIFTNRTKRKVISDTQLIGMVAFLLFIDIVILGSWQIADPLQVAIKNLPPQIDDVQDTATHRFISHCDCKHKSTWTVVMLGYKGIVLLLAAFLAWVSRKVYIEALNDSKLIGLAVYNVFIPCVLVIPVLHFLQAQVDAAYTLSTLLCIFCTTASLGIIFIPKIIHVYNHGDKDCQSEKRTTTSNSIEFGGKVGSSMENMPVNRSLSPVETTK